MLRVSNLTSTPPGMWKYLVPETGTWVPDRSALGFSKYVAFPDLIKGIKAHYKANSVTVPTNLDELVHDQCCRSIPSYCVDEKGRKDTSAPQFHFDLNTVIQGTLTLADWVIHGSPVESDEVIVDRTSACDKCQFNQDPQGCSSCNRKSLTRAIEKVVGKRKLASDSKLKSCMICGCSLIAKVRIPKDILLRHMSEEQIKRLPSHCWLK